MLVNLQISQHLVVKNLTLNRLTLTQHYKFTVRRYLHSAWPIFPEYAPTRSLNLAFGLFLDLFQVA